MQPSVAVVGSSPPVESDLGPLAWVLDELRKSLDSAVSALRRFVRDAEASRGSDIAALDASQLRIARQQLHQAVGALEMVGLEVPAKVLRAMQMLAQKFVQRPGTCNERAAQKLEGASFALIEYLEGLLKGRTTSAVALFPQYRDVLKELGEERIHPADLWVFPWRWRDIPLAPTIRPLAYDAPVCARIDSFVLQVVKTGHGPSAQILSDISLGFAAAQQESRPRGFWCLCAAYFEAMATVSASADVYAKRSASRILTQFRSLAKGVPDISERLAQDLLFHCAQTEPVRPAPSILSVARESYGLRGVVVRDVERPCLGRFDPALVAQARKRIAALTETWSALSGGDMTRMKQSADQMTLVTDSMIRLHPGSKDLADALLRSMVQVQRSGQPPTPALALEVATSVLYLDAAYEDLGTEDALEDRSARLAQRIDAVCGGAASEPLDAWMEDLYRRVSDRQVMGSVVQELAASLAEIETTLDAFFRNPVDKTALHDVPMRLAQMRGVFSVLGLDQAAMAAVRIRSRVEQCLEDDIDADAAARTGVFDKIGNSLGALGFLVDMLGYQRELAKQLFVYDEQLGEFRSLMGRHKTPVDEAPAPAPVASPLPPVAPASPPTPQPAPEPAPSDEEDEDELRDIFLEEARDVIQSGIAAISHLESRPADIDQQTRLRRTFHTLKGSSRMVGLVEFGEAAWAMEQLMNAWLAQQKPIGAEVLTLSSRAMQGFARWIEDIAENDDGAWAAQPFRQAADRMRMDNELIALPLPGEDTAPEPVAAPMPEPTPDLAPELLHESDAEDTAPTPLFSIEQPAAEVLAVEPPAMEPDAALPPELEVASPIDAAAHAGALAAFGEVDESEDVEECHAPDVLDQPLEPQELQEPQESRDAEAPLESDDLALDFSVDLIPAAEADTASAAAWTEAPVDVLADATEAVGDMLAELPTLAPWAASGEDIAMAALPEVPPELASSTEEGGIGKALHEVYLSEAEVWSLRLVDELEKGAAAPHQRVPDSTIGLVHSLAGSSATVGFHALSELARALEHALAHLQPAGVRTAEQEGLFVQVARSMRAMVHGFGIGHLPFGVVQTPDADPAQLSALHDMLAIELDAPEESRPIMQDADAGFDADFGMDLGGDLGLDFTMEPAMDPTMGRSDRDIATGATVAEEDLAPIELDFGDWSPAALPPLELPDLDLPVDAHNDADALDALPAVEPFPPSSADSLAERVGHPDDAASIDMAAMQEEPVHLAALAESVAQGQSDLALAVGTRQAQEPEVVAPQSREDSALQDTPDVDLFSIFEEEAHELLPRLGAALRQWSANPADLAARQSVLRDLHTLKGGARLAGAMRLGDMLHRLESAAEHVDTASPAAMAALLAGFDAIVHRMEGVCAAAASAIVFPEQVPATAGAADVSEAAAPAPVAVRKGGTETVRVRSQWIERMIGQTGEVLTARARIESHVDQLRGAMHDLTANLDRLHQQLRDLELQTDTQLQSRLALTRESDKGFDPLEFDRYTRVQELSRMLAESVHDIGTVQGQVQQSVSGVQDALAAQLRQARELQRDLLRTRMVEFDSIAERLHGVVRLAAREAGKSVALTIIGGAQDIDRGVLDRMGSAFEHLLRNAVCHGMEDEATRLERGKPSQGTITITLAQQGNDVRITFADDGGGLDIAAIRERAVRKGWVTADQVLSEEDIAQLIFSPGLSTAESVTELAGRGVGMDVVRNDVHAAGGRIDLHTRSGEGTRFHLVLPLTTAVTQVVMLRAGAMVFGVPTHLIERVVRLPWSALESAYATGRFPYAGQDIDLYWADALWQCVPGAGHESTPSRNASVAIVCSAGQRMALHVEEVLGNREAVVKNLGPQLARMPGLVGMSVQASGTVFLIYNPLAVAKVHGQCARFAPPCVVVAAGAHAGTAAAAQAPGAVPGAMVAPEATASRLIMVVDDSITVRRVTQRLLRREGFEVVLAHDGLHALELLQEQRPVVVLSDIEMPRMDGFDLIRNIRADERLRALPVIVITSRIAEKHRDYAHDLQVNHYLGKPYPEDELIGLLHQYCAAA
ncbi:Hpt domain-containing protein [Candidatus Symbiobacter mobilis]|uniref:Chemotaxis protein CheA n=1 Tax=Candidatus Symbiobacter mobilis CR TaxID=946483 RepID=U5N6P2_9BURK|nr:Hpt domain-containing protein [Candidatus Symbiobacter mobilis]AGX87211.1 chemosensory pili system protein ChpA [Candidatus Symbiobacter mobilis CR]